MTRDQFNRFCATLPAATHVVQWGNSDVWKVGGKVFAICNANGAECPGITFKTSPIAFEILGDVPGLRPAPYLASRGLKWIQRHGEESLSLDELGEYLTRSHELVVEGLSRKRRAELGL